MALTTKFVARKAIDKFQGGFLLRPVLLALLLGAAGQLLASFELMHPGAYKEVPDFFSLPYITDPQVAQTILSDIATAMMTVVSIVFSVLLMTLTLTSTQFSPRIIIAFVRDGITQATLGFFLGTFLYCLAALSATRITLRPFSPPMAVLGAMLLALICVGLLLFFINHIAMSVNVNYIVHKIARATETMIDATMPGKREPVKHEVFHVVDMGEEQADIRSNISGYVRYIDADRLYLMALRHNLRINVIRRIGHFVPEGVPLLCISASATPALEKELRGAFDIGPTRTLESDIEFGILQIVDIALRAISPAVNDPSTAITCIDQLSSILIRYAARENPKTMFYSSSGALCLSIPWLGFDRLFESAFEQIRLYSQSDIAVSLRLLRALSDIMSTLHTDEPKIMFVEFARVLAAGCSEKLGNDVLKEIRSRIAALEKLAL